MMMREEFEKWRMAQIDRAVDKTTHEWEVWQAGRRAGAMDMRERAAKVCDSVNNYDNPMTASDCAADIRELPVEE